MRVGKVGERDHGVAIEAVGERKLRLVAPGSWNAMAGGVCWVHERPLSAKVACQSVLINQCWIAAKEPFLMARQGEK